MGVSGTFIFIDKIFTSKVKIPRKLKSVCKLTYIFHHRTCTLHPGKKDKAAFQNVWDECTGLVPLNKIRVTSWIPVNIPSSTGGEFFVSTLYYEQKNQFRQKFGHKDIPCPYLYISL